MSQTADALFEDAFFTASGREPGKRTASVSFASRELDALVARTMTLRFDVAKRKMPGIRVARRGDDYVVSGVGAHRRAMDLMQFIAADNGRVQLTFSEELNNFDPEPDLINKSKNPLWVMRSLDSGSVLISRIWKST